MKVYLAGPMSSKPDFNFLAFFVAAVQLRQQGHVVFCPAEEDVKEWGDLDSVRAKANYRDCMRKDLNWILDHAEAIALLPGWEESKGARVEEQLARMLGLQVMIL